MNEQIEAVQRMQDYIEKHIDTDITLSDLSRASQYSPWHSYRIFRDYLGLTPAQYIRRLRLSHSSMRLKNERCLVTDVAYAYGFDSIDGYSRAFFKEFGYHPGDYVKDPVPITLFIPYGVKFKELREDIVDMENIQNVFIQVIRKPERKVIMKRGISAQDYFEYCEEVGCDIWGTMLRRFSLCSIL